MLRLALVVIMLALLAPATPSHGATTCTFSQGTTTCTATEQSTETETRNLVSGCLYGPSGVPGRRTRTFTDTYLTTTTSITLQRGRDGRVYDARTETTRTLADSVLVSDTCEAL